MLVSYFIPEDGDAKEHPNVFSCEANTLTLSELRKAFPVPGKYHFRALKAVGDMNVWLDLVDEAGVVPPYRGEVVLKVSRISLGGAARQSSGTFSPGVSQQQTQSTSSSPRTRDEGRGQSQSMGATQETSPRMTVPERRGSEKLLSFDTFDESNTTPPASTASPFDSNAGDVFDFSKQETPQQQQSQPPQHQRQNSNNTMNDFMNFPTSSATPPPMMNNSMQGGGMGGMGAMGGGMHRGGGSSGNINGMNQMNANNMRQQQQKQQQNRNAMGGLDPFGSF
mmetsp:Transcript_17064/g.28494  ORF Transcript_17064/g.28494 Transcript_17064/m.28494 type:complete len:280 (-) Transcript_17064:883-1722(-)